MDESRPWASRLRNERLHHAPPWSQLRAAIALEEVAMRYGLAVPSRESLLRMVKGWERGDHQPSDFYRSLWSMVYNVPERVLFAELPPSTLSVLGLGLVAVEAGEDAGGQPMRRREVLVSGSLFGSLAFVGPAQPLHVGMTEVREVSSAARSLQRWDRQFGGGVPYQAAVGFVDSAMRLVRGTYTERTGRALLPAVADLCAVTGWITHDIGQTRQALGYFSLGVQVAQQGQDSAVAARLLSDMARVNADLGNPMQSIELLQLARHVSQSHTSALVAAKLHSLEAKTYAILGRADECVRAIHEAERWLADGANADQPGWIRYFNEAQLDGVIGSCFRDLATIDARYALQAEAPIHRAMRNRNHDQLRNQALDHLNLATARLRRGEIDGMIEEGTTAANLAQALKSHRTNARLRWLSRQPDVAESRLRSVTELRDRIAALPATIV